MFTRIKNHNRYQIIEKPYLREKQNNENKIKLNYTSVKHRYNNDQMQIILIWRMGKINTTAQHTG